MTDPLDAPASKKDLLILQRKLEQVIASQVELAGQELLKELKNHLHVLADNARHWSVES